MSEYQYYEFQAIDRRLTPAEMQRLRTYSTRAQITPTSFVNEYNWGDFKGDSDAWMERYFDAFLYFANWGTRILKLRLSARALDSKLVRMYLDGDYSSFRQKGDHLILTFTSELDGGDDSCDLEGGGLLSSLISVRAELARGDRRALYLGWLSAVQNGELDDDAVEPPVPAGFGELSGSLAALADFLRIDADLIEAAAQASAPSATLELPHRDVLAWVGSLSPFEKDEILTRLIVAPDDSATALMSAELRRKFCKARDANRPAPLQSSEARRTVGELLQAAERRTAQRTQAAARKTAEQKERREREAAAARVRHLDALVGQEPRLWAEVERLAATKLPKSYDQTVVHLVDLRDLAMRADGGADFATQLARFRATHARKPSLLDRLNRGGL